MHLCKFLTLCVLVALSGGSAEAATKRPPAKKPAATASKSKARTSKPAGKSRAASKQGKATASRGRTSSSARQMAPTPQRYMEVQQALAEKGYYTGPIDGNWGTECVDALRRFQSDQNIPVDGKLGALSLIGLGLGPKREPLQTQMLAKPASVTPTP